MQNVSTKDINDGKKTNHSFLYTLTDEHNVSTSPRNPSLYEATTP